MGQEGNKLDYTRPTKSPGRAMPGGLSLSAEPTTKTILSFGLSEENAKCLLGSVGQQVKKLKMAFKTLVFEMHFKTYKVKKYMPFRTFKSPKIKTLNVRRLGKGFKK